MTDYASGPWAHPPRKPRPRIGTTWLVTVALCLLILTGAAVDNLNQYPWLLETFAAAHPDHPRGY